MASDQTNFPFWPAAFRYARVCLAGLCLSVLAAPRTAWAAVSLSAAFVLYALAAVLWPGDRHEPAPLGLLLVDLVFFLCWLVGPGGDRLLIAAAFFAYVILSAAILHSWRETLVAGILPALFLWIARPPVAAQMFACVAVGTIIAIFLSIQKRWFSITMEEANKAVENWRIEAQNASNAERQRIAADFHDGPLQSFISFQMRLQIIRTLLQRNQAGGMAELEQLQELCRGQVAEIRAFIRGMRPPDDDGAGLLTASSRLVDLFQKDTGILSTFHRGAPLGPNEPEGSTEILQLIREALNNIQKHSKASRAAVSMGRVDNALEITVEDDGTGFPFGGSYTLEELDALGLGPVSIKQRIRNIGGDLTVDSRPGHGAALWIRVPL